MHGLVVVGTAAGTGAEQEVAEALDGAEFRVPGGETDAPPLVTARHQGTALDPRALLEEARATAGEHVLVTTSGGLLAPLAERYTNRDLALELALPVVLAAPTSPTMLNETLLTLEAARGAGLAVAAVVIAGWPETPPRVLLDVRRLLEQQAGVPVAVAQAGLPLAEWADAAVAAAPADAATPARVTLEPYEAWEPHTVGDPRSTPRAQIMGTMLEIVGREGPMTAGRAYALYNRASGGKKLTSVARAPLSSSIYWLAQERKVVLVRKEEIPWQDDDVVRMPDSPAVRVRELGGRTLEEVPLDEIAELMRRLRAARGIADAAEMKRAVLGTYGLVRLTTRADEYLGLALDLASSSPEGSDG